MLDLVRLRVLAAVAAHGSVTKAAKHLHYAQPSVSHHLARLEAETGARLVQRVGRGIRLTPEGELLARRAAEIIGRVDAAEAELEAMVGLRTGRVRVAGFQSALSTLVPEAAAALRRDHPGIQLQLVDAHPVAAMEMLRTGEVDAAVVFRYEEDLPGDIRGVHLFDDPMYLLSARAGDTLLDHRRSAWIGGCVRCRQELLELCEAAGFTPEIAYTSDEIIVQQALVATGLGVTTAPGLALRTHRRDDIEATEIDRSRRIHLVTYGEPPDPPATTAFIAALHVAAEQYA
ncbi:LysR family transcriptional regulator [Glycomyces algeriensis]|uniref:LysR family transcriptional regulator n=1 Tax=Glycomyces algeriensis TaxID=256037 RepID=A0A9W6G9A2_9ACTN|nr:LysR family transcriptional regulator [Glycomyces algeriensis]MDA1365046.1 LysR family transcriptional regulator [Glycomyces algeriensis]MDR7349892.1 DNA-binding transcriptional LysR family regulator [Glycomyces algeriensis]GLI42603.1 LysR family transcriptional regulator [Glycomyces algeriensis]